MEARHPGRYRNEFALNVFAMTVAGTRLVISSSCFATHDTDARPGCVAPAHTYL